MQIHGYTYLLTIKLSLCKPTHSLSLDHIRAGRDHSRTESAGIDGHHDRMSRQCRRCPSDLCSARFRSRGLGWVHSRPTATKLTRVVLGCHHLARVPCLCIPLYILSPLARHGPMRAQQETCAGRQAPAHAWSGSGFAAPLHLVQSPNLPRASNPHYLGPIANAPPQLCEKVVSI